ncbi:MAG TPA: isochorismate synthase, partial [Polyangiales bacterium]
ARGWLLNSVEAARGRVQPSLERERAALEAHAGYGVGFQPTPRKYVEAVTRALRSIEARELDKVVLARRLELAFDEPIDCSEWLRRFYAQNPAAYVFSIDLAAPGEPLHKLMGASPELLLQKRGAQVATNPLAGSRARGRDKQEDEARVRELLSSDKDRREHALVVDAVASTLRSFCTDLQLPKQPSLLSTPTMWHLSTSITGKLRDPDCSSIELVQALHPTPAVAGLPRERALSLIAELEGGARGPFAGAVGHCDAQGDGEWAVSLRCVELRPQSAVLFAGAGIVAGSDPWSELDETGAKFRTALRALGVPLLSGAS